jgi:hypothetical protein
VELSFIGFAAASRLSYTFVTGEFIPFKHPLDSLAFLNVSVVTFSGFGPAMLFVFPVHKTLLEVLLFSDSHQRGSSAMSVLLVSFTTFANYSKC